MPFKMIMCLISFAFASLIVFGVFLNNPKYWPILDIGLFLFLSMNGWFWYKSKA